jgi:hypothetical protein
MVYSQVLGRSRGMVYSQVLGRSRGMVYSRVQKLYVRNKMMVAPAVIIPSTSSSMAWLLQASISALLLRACYHDVRPIPLLLTCRTGRASTTRPSATTRTTSMPTCTRSTSCGRAGGSTPSASGAQRCCCCCCCDLYAACCFAAGRLAYMAHVRMFANAVG